MVKQPSSFRADVHFFPPAQYGRPKPAYQGYRPTLLFDGDTTYLGFFINFLNKNGEPFPDGSPLPSEVLAEFSPLSTSDEETHRILSKHAKVGQALSLTEGTHVIARGIVISADP